MAQYIVISDRGENPVSYAIDTDEERGEARAAMTAAGVEESAVYVGDPEDPSSYANGASFKNDSGEIHSMRGARGVVCMVSGGSGPAELSCVHEYGHADGHEYKWVSP